MTAAPSPAALDASSIGIEAERQVLGSCLSSLRAYEDACGAGLRGEHFASELHLRIWTAIGQAYRDAAPKALPVVQRRMSRDAVWVEARASPDYLVDLVAVTLSDGQVHDYAAIVIETWQRRAAAEIGRRIGCAAALGSSDVEWRDQLADLVRELAQVEEGTSATCVDLSAAEAVGRAIDLVTEAQQGGRRGVPAGIGAYDQATHGFRPGTLNLLAGRPGMGKSTVGLQMAVGAARAGYQSLFLTLEMSVDEVSLRLASMLAADAGLRVPYGLLTGGERLTPEQIEAIGRAQDVAHTLPLAIIQPRPYLGTIEGIIAFRRRRAEKEGRQLGLVVIDQLTQVWPPERYRGRKVDEIGEITASLKQTALRFGVPILLLHQLNRAVEGRSDRRPQLADLRDSGSLEQDADTVTLCYRPDYYLAREEPADPDAQITWRDAMREAEGRFELIIAKERMGATGVVTLRHDLPTGRILDEGVMI